MQKITGAADAVRANFFEMIITVVDLMFSNLVGSGSQHVQSCLVFFHTVDSWPGRGSSRLLVGC